MKRPTSSRGRITRSLGAIRPMALLDAGAPMGGIGDRGPLSRPLHPRRHIRIPENAHSLMSFGE
jgi:hypothetical protein